MRAQMEALSFTNIFVNRIKEAFIISKKTFTRRILINYIETLNSDLGSPAQSFLGFLLCLHWQSTDTVILPFKKYIFTNGDPELDGCCEAPLLGRFWVPIFWEDCNVIGDWPRTGVFPFFPFLRSSFVQIFFTAIKTNEEFRSDGIYYYLLFCCNISCFEPDQRVIWILVL